MKLKEALIMKRSVLFAFILSVISMAGCDLINPEEQTPTYVQIDSFTFIPPIDPIATAGYTHQITSCWVYFDGKQIGVFDLPARVPILMDKPGRLTVSPGIVVNGRKDYQARYPYYSSDTITITPKKGEIISFVPKTKYVPDAKFVWREDFEGGNDFTRLSGDTDINKSNLPEAKLDGGFSGYIFLRSPKSKMEAITTSVPFKASGADVVMEIDYRSSMPFYVGLQSAEQNRFEYLIGVNPREQRNKIYVSLSGFLSSYPSTTGYRVQIRAELPAGQTEGFVALDNMKIISFQQ